MEKEGTFLQNYGKKRKERWLMSSAGFKADVYSSKNVGQEERELST